ncbi:MAG TPA: OB-fold nucleic acid binding domain-containing protein, partial [Thermoanaerobaculia bacterium]|nr:OB-fold nucleic acid binding domain-containing protein [Thermoanaerobaculia bacterium]
MKRQPAGVLSAADAGKKVLLRGWVGRRRDLGELIFLNVRDRSGLVQVLFERVRSGEEAVARAADARAEDVVEIEGEVA